MPDEKLELKVTPMGTQQLKAVAYNKAKENFFLSLRALQLELPREVWDHHVDVVKSYFNALADLSEGSTQ